MQMFLYEQGRKFYGLAGSVTAGTFSGTDLSSYTDLKIVFRKPSGRTLEKTATLEAGSGTFDGVTIPANEYCSVVFTGTDINEKGQWQSQIIWTDGTYQSGTKEWVDCFEVVDSAYGKC